MCRKRRVYELFHQPKKKLFKTNCMRKNLPKNFVASSCSFSQLSEHFVESLAAHASEQIPIDSSSVKHFDVRLLCFDLISSWLQRSISNGRHPESACRIEPPVVTPLKYRVNQKSHGKCTQNIGKWSLFWSRFFDSK